MEYIRIRRATGIDAEGLTALVQESQAYRGQYASVIVGYKVTAAYIERHQVFAAIDITGQLVGFYSLILDPAELDLAFVSDEAQGTGVGKLLMEHMLDQAQSAGLTDVRVVSNPPAERFYLRMGAERVGVVAPTPPKVTWDRPELRFVVSRQRVIGTEVTAIR
ncbi:GNAT family N-acetyltransferase [Streptomyces sp. NPDC044571]|uniref:GNAT family N-acetyltransferase n=1 Tax=Streptomyces sp. NPDC044571 TaxID=3155371 RepID=UPI0033CE5D8E